LAQQPLPCGEPVDVCGVQLRLAGVESLGPGEAGGGPVELGEVVRGRSGEQQLVAQFATELFGGDRDACELEALGGVGERPRQRTAQLVAGDSRSEAVYGVVDGDLAAAAGAPPETGGGVAAVCLAALGAPACSFEAAGVVAFSVAAHPLGEQVELGDRPAQRLVDRGGSLLDEREQRRGGRVRRAPGAVAGMAGIARFAAAQALNLVV